MGAAERRERERAQLRAKILDAARELFVDHGYDAVTLRKVASSIEYSTTAIYVHFKDKRELIRELVAEDFRRHAKHFAQAATIQHPVERLRAAGKLYVDFAIQFPNHYRMMFMSPPNIDQNRVQRPDGDSYAFLLSCVRACVDQGHIRPDVTDVDLIAQVLWANVHGIASLYIAKGKRTMFDWRSVDDQLTLLFDTYWDGLFVPAADPEQP